LDDVHREGTEDGLSLDLVDLGFEQEFRGAAEGIPGGFPGIGGFPGEAGLPGELLCLVLREPDQQVAARYPVDVPEDEVEGDKRRGDCYDEVPELVKLRDREDVVDRDPGEEDDRSNDADESKDSPDNKEERDYRPGDLFPD